MYKGEFGEPQREQQIIHVQGIGGQIWALNWNQPSAKRLRVGRVSGQQVVCCLWAMSGTHALLLALSK